MPTGSAEREAERIVESVCHVFFIVGNLQGIGFLDSSGKPIGVSDTRAADIKFFYFRSTVLARTIDQRFLTTVLLLYFSLRLPQSITSTASPPAPTLTSGIRTPPGTPKTTMVQTPASRSISAFALDNATDDELNSMDATQLRQFILTARPSPYPASGVTTPSVNLLPSLSSLTSSSTPKMDRVRKSVASVGVTIYIGSLDLLDSQASFDSILGNTLVILRVTRRTAGSCATEETEYLATRINTYCNLCQLLHLFCSIVKLQFVGTENYDTHRMMHDIYLALSELKLVYKSHGKLVTLTSDTLFQQFIEFPPLLPSMRPLGLLVLLLYFITH